MRGTCGAAPAGQQPTLRLRRRREAALGTVLSVGEVAQGSRTDKMIQQHPRFLSINPSQLSRLQPLHPWAQPQPGSAAHKTRRAEPLALSPAQGQRRVPPVVAKQHNGNFALRRHEPRGAN